MTDINKMTEMLEKATGEFHQLALDFIERQPIELQIMAVFQTILTEAIISYSSAMHAHNIPYDTYMNLVNATAEVVWKRAKETIETNAKKEKE